MEKITMTAPNGMKVQTNANDTERWKNHFFKVGETARNKREENAAARNQRYYGTFKGSSKVAAPVEEESLNTSEAPEI